MSEKKDIFQTSIFGFHVSFRGAMLNFVYVNNSVLKRWSVNFPHQLTTDVTKLIVSSDDFLRKPRIHGFCLSLRCVFLLSTMGKSSKKTQFWANIFFDFCPTTFCKSKVHKTPWKWACVCVCFQGCILEKWCSFIFENGSKYSIVLWWNVRI